MGQAYERLGSSEGRKAYERVTSEFADQKETVAEARTRLAALDGARTASTIATRVLWSGSDVDFDASIIPDGRLMMTDWSSGDLAIRDMTTGQIRRLMAKMGSWQESNSFGQNPVLSSDLRQVAYAWYESAGDHYELRVMPNEVGAKPRILIRNPEFNYFTPVAWSHDGKSILAKLWKPGGTGQIAWVSAADGTIRVITSLDWRLQDNERSSLSPDGRYIAYSAWERSDSKNSAIYVVAADGSRQNVLMKSAGMNRSPIWTPDGRHVIYLSNRSGSLDIWSIEVRDGNAAGVPVLVKSDAGSISPIGFTSSGSYYYGHADGTEDVFLGELDAASGKIRGHVAVTESFVGSNRNPVWSPDGKFIVFHSQRQRGNRYPTDVVVHSIETGDERTYSSNGLVLAGNAMWFHDGKALLQGLRDQQGKVFFYRVDLKSGGFTEVVATGGTSGSMESALSPDDKTVYTNIGPDAPGIHAFDLTSGQERRVFTAEQRGGIPGLGLSPDGRTLAFKIVISEKNENHLCVVGIDGRNFIDLYTETADHNRVRPQLAWTRDGRAILFTRWSSAQDWQLLRIPAGGGTPDYTGLTGRGTPGINLNPDGTRIAFNDGTAGIPELWTLDNLPISKPAR
jgi:Tol biopolymer transport system component